MGVRGQRGLQSDHRKNSAAPQQSRSSHVPSKLLAGAGEGGVLLQESTDTAVIFIYPLFRHQLRFFFSFLFLNMRETISKVTADAL